MPGAVRARTGSLISSDDDYVDISASPLFTSSHLSDTTLRPIQLSTRSSQVRVPVPTTTYEAWITAIVVRDDFHRNLTTMGKDGGETPAPIVAVDEDEEEGEEADAVKARRAAQAVQQQLEGRLVLAARFLGYLAARVASGNGNGNGNGSSASAAASSNTTASAPSHESNILQCAWAAFNHQFLLAPQTDLHKLTATLDSDVRTEVLRSYYEALVVLESNAGTTPELQMPKLLALASKGEAKLFGIFGGQGSNEVYFDELQELYNTYRPLVAPLLAEATQQLEQLVEEARLAGFGSFYTHGVDVTGWLSGSVARPATSYLASIPLSLPLIGLTQLTQYVVAIRASGLTAGQFRERFAGATGHSQGVISAIVLSASGSDEQLSANVIKALRLLFHIGKRGQEGFPTLSLDAALVADAVEGGEGEPTPMLSVTGLTQAALEKEVSATNKLIDESAHHIDISLFNGPTNFVVTGPPRTLFGLVGSLRLKRAAPDLDQSRVPFSKRKPVFNIRFLPVGVPYHSRHLINCTEKVISQDLANEQLFSATDLTTAVHHTCDGTDLRSLGAQADLVRSACDQIFTQHIHWLKACNVPDATTHCIDFGTGGLSGIGGLTLRNLDGRGVRVVTVSGRHRYSAELYDVAKVQRERPWSDYAPKLIKTVSGVQLDTPLSRILGRPPIVVGGMTPTTVQAGFNAAAANAGYHIELAGGGHYNAKALRAKIDALQDMVEPGVGFTLNSLYINQRQFSVQFPEWLAMRREGYPLQGFVCAAGIPSPEKAKELIGGLQSAGLRHITFKPGSLDGIKQVCAIAELNPTFGIILCWTGGRAGGHHSPEDLYAPLLAAYSRIRAHSNIAICIGSGMGQADGSDVWEFLSGRWSQAFGLPPAPCDGVYYGSWCMIAKEAHTADAVKQLIVEAPGTKDDAMWESDTKAGTISINSELGEQMSVIKNRATQLWDELDRTLFAL